MRTKNIHSMIIGGPMMDKTNFLRIHSRLVMVLMPVMFTSLLSTALARADVLTVSLSPLSNVAAGSTGDSLDVLLRNTSGPAVSIEGFFFELLASSPDVTFTDATTTTGTGYIFGAGSLFGPDIIGPGSTPQDLSGSDLDSAGSVSLASGATVALGHVLFNVSPTALTPTVNFPLAGFPGTSLADDSGNNVPITTLNGGQFQINGAPAPVPEPSTLILLFTVMPLLW